MQKQYCTNNRNLSTVIVTEDASICTINMDQCTARTYMYIHAVNLTYCLWFLYLIEREEYLVEQVEHS